jgi:hypothetical protein
MRVGVLIFHSNIQKIYKIRWVDKCVKSLINQTFEPTKYYEIDYGGDNYSVLNGYDVNRDFYSMKLNNYAEAMNFILDKAFNDGCDYVFNTNLDDYYDVNRIKLQMDAMLLHSYDVLSTDFCYVRENSNNEDVVFHNMNISKYSNRIFSEFELGHNVIAHPAVCYSRKFWTDGNRYDGTKVPEEDFDLWTRSMKLGYSFGILPQNLLFYRIHNKQESSKNI